MPSDNFLFTLANGIPCRVQITHYIPAKPMRVTGWGYGDADPPEPEEIEWHLEDPDSPGEICKLREGLATQHDRNEIDYETHRRMGKAAVFF
jgi:hypothetical protein